MIMLIRNCEECQAGIDTPSLSAFRQQPLPPSGAHTALRRILVLFTYERRLIMPVEIAVNPLLPSIIMRFACGGHIEKDTIT